MIDGRSRMHKVFIPIEKIFASRAPLRTSNCQIDSVAITPRAML